MKKSSANHHGTIFHLFWKFEAWICTLGFSEIESNVMWTIILSIKRQIFGVWEFTSKLRGVHNHNQQEISIKAPPAGISIRFLSRLWWYSEIKSLFLNSKHEEMPNISLSSSTAERRRKHIRIRYATALLLLLWLAWPLNNWKIFSSLFPLYIVQWSSLDSFLTSPSSYIYAVRRMRVEWEKYYEKVKYTEYSRMWI